MAIGLEMVGSILKYDSGVRLVIIRVRDGTDEAGCTTINKIFEERVGIKHKEISHATTSDRAAKIIATMFNHNKDVCDMCCCDGIGKSAIRHLIRDRNKV